MKRKWLIVLGSNAVRAKGKAFGRSSASAMRIREFLTQGIREAFQPVKSIQQGFALSLPVWRRSQGDEEPVADSSCSVMIRANRA